MSHLAPLTAKDEKGAKDEAEQDETKETKAME
jgi:hypothetical protein